MQSSHRWISRTRPGPQASIQNLLNTSPGCLDGLFQCPGLDLSSYTFSLIIWKKGNAAQEWDASPFTLGCNLVHPYEAGENSPIGQWRRQNGPALPAEAHDSHLVKCQSPSPAELSAMSHMLSSSSDIGTHLCPTLQKKLKILKSEAIQSDLVFRKLFVVLQV